MLKSAQASNNQLSQNQEIMIFFDNYMQYYNDYIKDRSNSNALNLLAETYHKSAFQIIPGVPISPLDDTQKIAAGSQRFLDSLVSQGVAHIEWQKVNIELLTEVTAYASNVGVRYKKDGKVLNKAAADYLIVKTPQGWKIAALVLRSVNEAKSAENIREVQGFLANYLKNYNDALSDDSVNNANTIPSLIAASENLYIPAINVTKDGRFVLFTSKKHIADDTKTFILDLKKLGSTYIDYEKIQIKMLTDATALASNVASINKADNSALLKIGATYLIHKTDDGWKIIVRTFHAADNILRIN